MKDDKFKKWSNKVEDSVHSPEILLQGRELSETIAEYTRPSIKFKFNKLFEIKYLFFSLCPNPWQRVKISKNQPKIKKKDIF